MDYRILTAPERLAILESFLRDREAEHYRLAMLPIQDPSRDQRLAAVEAELKTMQKEYDSLKKA